MTGAALLTVVEVPKEERVLCAACGHSVYRRIHVVQDGAGLRVLGSDCFKQLYGHLDQSTSTPRYGNSEGRTLTEAERQMLVDNTQRFIDQLEVERLQQDQQELHRRAIEQQEAAQREAADRQRLAALRASHRRRLRFPDWLAELTPAEREAFERVRRQASDAMRAKFNIDPELPGWLGMLNHEARTAFESQHAVPTSSTGEPSSQSGDLFGDPDTNASESK
ncbi:hypothetical protein [Variovorax sp. dw_954]|uniref:hypothetical protein n=1 Tax=Variovorax sp. dw_954 TaxID=2720078 RepID=UPI001BD1C058|nr:hypothetical protein [Variovorax sp. dw_954]